MYGTHLHDYDALKAGTYRVPQWALDFKSEVPEGETDRWKVEKFEIPLDLQNMRMMRDGRGCPPGTYTRLVRKSPRGLRAFGFGETCVMSDTMAEASDHRTAITAATGRVLIHGLGLGCFLHSILRKPSVTHIDVVEKSDEVLSLVSPSFTDPRVVFHHADCLTHKWTPGTRWDCVWHDIWDTICEDYKPAMTKLRRSFSGRCDWQGCWASEVLDSFTLTERPSTYDD